MNDNAASRLASGRSVKLRLECMYEKSFLKCFFSHE
jgi:hypothetical protein